jgi:hypothetical protein
VQVPSHSWARGLGEASRCHCHARLKLSMQSNTGNSSCTEATLPGTAVHP